jgi:membrane protease YdiL (CAAX protease family)
MSVDQIPIQLKAILGVLEVICLVMFGFALWKWRERSAEGFVIGQKISWSPLSLRQACFLLGALLLAKIQIGLIAEVFRKFGYMNTQTQQALFVIVTSWIFYLFVIMLISLFLKRRGFSWNQAFGFRNIKFSHALMTAAVVLPALFIPLEIVSVLTQLIFKIFNWPIDEQFIVEFFRKLSNPWLKLGIISISSIGAPIAEELLFRGIFYPFLKERYGFFTALMINSAVFGIFHEHAPSILPLFALAIIFTLAYEWTGNLLTCILLHAGFNTISVTAMLLIDKFR